MAIKLIPRAKECVNICPASRISAINAVGKNATNKFDNHDYCSDREREDEFPLLHRTILKQTFREGILRLRDRGFPFLS